MHADKLLGSHLLVQHMRKINENGLKIKAG